MKSIYFVEMKSSAGSNRLFDVKVAEVLSKEQMVYYLKEALDSVTDGIRECIHCGGLLYRYEDLRLVKP